MTEVSVESDGALPWVGGWLVLVAAPDAPEAPSPESIGDLARDLDWTFENGILHLRCRHPAAPLEIRWRPGSNGESSVDLSLWTAARPSAT
jgi:hypothetical protein